MDVSTNQYDDNQVDRHIVTGKDQSNSQDVEVALPKSTSSDSFQLKENVVGPQGTFDSCSENSEVDQIVPPIESYDTTPVIVRNDSSPGTTRKRNTKYKLVIASICLSFIVIVVMAVMIPIVFLNKDDSTDADTLDKSMNQYDETLTGGHPTKSNTTNKNKEYEENDHSTTTNTSDNNKDYGENLPTTTNTSNNINEEADVNGTTTDGSEIEHTMVPTPIYPVQKTGAPVVLVYPTAAPISQSDSSVIPLDTPTALGVWNVLTAHLSNSSELQNDPSSLHYQVFKWMINPTSEAGNTSSSSNLSYVNQIVGDDPMDIESDPVRSTKILQRYTLAYLYAKLHSAGGTSLSNTTTVGTSGRRLTSLSFGYSQIDECSWPGVICTNSTAQNVSDGMTSVVDRLIWAQKGLTGEIPREIRDLKHLTYLDLADNALSGPIPDFIYDMVKLKELYLHSNQLTGSISSKIGQLLHLEKIFLYSNLLTGEIPNEFGSPANSSGHYPRPLKYINLFNNSLEGPLPSRINWTQLYYLDLGLNRFTGTIPDDWVYGQGSFSKLRNLYLDHNNLEGDLPSMFPNLGAGRAELIDISNNNFTGGYSFETSYSETEFLFRLEIQNNSFSYISDKVCELSILEVGELVRINADCNACSCKTLCDKCNSNGDNSNGSQGGNSGQEGGKDKESGPEDHGPGGR